MKFLNNYPKAIWAAKYNFILVPENVDDAVEVCEEQSLFTEIYVFLHKFN